MYKKYWLKITLFFLFLAGSFVVLGFYPRSENNSTCSESMEECTKSNNTNNASGELIWDAFSRQFISSVDFGR